jgi:hypothetical protein
MTRVESLRSFVVSLATLAGFVFAAPEAHAQSAEAEVLFREGRKLIKAGKLQPGCDKLEASEKLESSVGTLLNLGDCREKLGRYASSWAAFRKAEATAKVQGRDEKRRNEASKRAIALEAKLSQLVILVPGRVSGLVVKRDEEVVDAAMWNTPLPVDPDTYTIVAEAPGFKPWRRDVTVTGKQRRVAVTVPALERAPAPEVLAPTTITPVVVQPPPLVPRVEQRSSSMWTPSRKVALGIGVAGVAAAGTGLYFGMRSRDLESRSNEVCPTALCDDPDALRDNDRAQTAARNANILYAVGGVALAASAVIWIVGGPDKEVRIAPNVGSDHAGVSFGGSF